MRFLLVDRILELDPARSIVAEKYVDGGEEYFQDHFPGYPVVPGVLMIEMMAQTAGKCLMAGVDVSRWPVLVQVTRASFRSIVLPGALLHMQATITSSNNNTAGADARVTVGGKRVADASLTFGYVDRKLLSAGFEDQVLAQYLQERGLRKS
jgi:3-hydroxyacyl-[acyl-carrier-protein] dehydratase